MALNTSQQILPGITFAKATAANIALANSATGGAASDLQEVIAPITLATGKITCTSGSPGVTGIGTAFTTDFSIGDYLFSYDLYDANPSLLGKISLISSDTSLTLSEDAPTTINAPGLYAGKTNSILAASDNIIMRVPVVRGSGTTFYLPNWNQWLSPTAYGQFNNSSTNNLKQYSKVGVPTTEEPSQPNIQYTIRPYYQGWASIPAPIGRNQLEPTLQYFPTAADIPTFAYALVNPYGNNSTLLAPNTLFKLFASQSFLQNCITAGLSYSSDLLRQAGYFV
jgi:hypothetical protein